MEMPVKLKPLTEEQISAVCKFFDTWDKGDYTESQLYFLYWRMRAQWIKFAAPEEKLFKEQKKKADTYRRKKEQEINEHLKQYRIETAWDNGKYELMKVNSREDGRSIVIWIMKSFDTENARVKRSHAVEIEERCNPDYFQEVIDRFNLVID